MSDTKLTAVRFPVRLVEELDRLVGKRRRSRFIVEATARELERLRQRVAGEAAFGAWREEDHPEIGDAAEWVRRQRREGERALGEGN